MGDPIEGAGAAESTAKAPSGDAKPEGASTGSQEARTPEAGGPEVGKAGAGETPGPAAGTPAGAAAAAEPMGERVVQKLGKENARLVNALKNLQGENADLKARAGGSAGTPGATGVAGSGAGAPRAEFWPEGLPRPIQDEEAERRGAVVLADGSEHPKSSLQLIVSQAQNIQRLEAMIEGVGQKLTMQDVEKRTNDFQDAVNDTITDMRKEFLPGYEGDTAQAVDILLTAATQAALVERTAPGTAPTQEGIAGAMGEAFDLIARVLATGQKAQAAADAQAKATEPVAGSGAAAGGTIDLSKQTEQEVRGSMVERANRRIQDWASKRGKDQAGDGRVY